MIDKSFIEKIEAMSEQKLSEVGGLQYSNKSLSLIAPPAAAKFEVCSLSAVVDFCESEMKDGQHVLHICSEKMVKLFGDIHPLFRRRELFIESASMENTFRFGLFYEVDRFIIAMQSQFVQDDVTAAILKLVGNMTRVSEVGTKDDGMTQRVEAKSGLAKVENISVPNPVCLAPYRTFIEVNQPYSNFVLRLNSDHHCALFEADGGAWRVEAMRNVKTYLDNSMKSIGKRDQITILC